MFGVCSLNISTIITLLLYFIFTCFVIPFDCKRLFDVIEDPKIFRFKRQQNFNKNPSLRGNADFSTQNGLTVPLFQRILGGDFLGDKYSGNVDITNPSVSANRGFDAFNLFNTNQGINRVGDRGQGNYGGGFGRSASILGGRLGAGDNTDVNFNKNNGLNVNRQRGIPGIVTQNTEIKSNPIGGNLFGTSQNTCIGEALLKGLCFQKQSGLGLGK